MPTERLAVDFMPGLPDLTSFPRHDWAWAMRESCQRAAVAAFGYGDPRGSPELRTVLASYLRRVRAAAADPDNLVICSGFAQGLNLILRALAREGVRQVAIEDPGRSRSRTPAISPTAPSPGAADSRSFPSR